jgi:hypothetical protein
MTQEELLQSTIDYYSVDPMSRRCATETNGCYYSPKRASKPTSEGCAIGRHLTEENKEELDRIVLNGFTSGEISAVLGFLNARKLLPDWMQLMDPLFLRSIQLLHDNGRNWLLNGLSPEGKSSIYNIISVFDLDPSKITIPE